MAIKDVLRSFPVPPYGMPYPEGTGLMPPEPPNCWTFNAADMPPFPEFPFASSAEVHDGVPSVRPDPAIQFSKELTENVCEGLGITGEGEGVNAIVVRSGDYKIKELEASVKGDGLNDFEGIGAVVMAAGESFVELRDSKITTEGVIRPCTFAEAHATLKVYNCELVSEGGYVPDDYIPIPGYGMRKAPLGLKIDGTCRTHLSVGNSNVYFYDSKIVADGWAALSTDGCTDELYLEANNCDVICRNSGYGVYSDGGCIVRLNDCRVKTATHSAIMAGDCKLTFDGCDLESGCYGVMMHGVHGFTSEISKFFMRDCKMVIDELPFFVKSTNAYIGIDNTTFETKSGVLVHSVINDDEHATKVTEEDNELYGIKVSVRKCQLSGDIIHDDYQRTMSVKLTDSQLSGAIKDAYISFSGASKWTATADSTVALVNVVDISSIDALEGVTIYAVAGKDTSLKGSYNLASGGRLVIE